MPVTGKGVTLHPLSGTNGAPQGHRPERKEHIERIAITDKVVQENGAPPGMKVRRQARQNFALVIRNSDFQAQ